LRHADFFKGTWAAVAKEERPKVQVKIALPAPDLVGRMPLEQALAQRRSLREFSSRPLSREELSQLLWAVQGITAPAKSRARSDFS
jgi:hypothetical protein